MKAKLSAAGLGGSALGLLAAYLTMWIFDGRLPDLTDIDWPILMTAVLLLLNGAWLPLALNLNKKRKLLQSLLRGALAALLALIISVSLTVVIYGLIESWPPEQTAFADLVQAVGFYLFLSLIFGGLQALLIGAGVGWYCHKKC